MDFSKFSNHTESFDFGEKLKIVDFALEIGIELEKNQRRKNEDEIIENEKVDN